MKSFTAVLTGVRSGIGMDQQVSGQSGRPFETFSADFAVKASLLRVNSFVLLQADRVPKGFPTQLAREGPGATVRPTNMNLQAVRCGKHFATFDALVRSVQQESVAEQV